VKSILVSQPDPGDKKTAYHALAEKYKLKLDFRPFIQVESVPAKELRKKRLNILDHTAIILTSRSAVLIISLDVSMSLKLKCQIR